MFNKKCKFCDKDFVAKVYHRYYCSDLCRSRFNLRKNGKAAKSIVCDSCGEYFKRKSPVCIKCDSCKDKIKKNLKKDTTYFPKTDRDVELKMQKDWLKNHKVKVG